MALEKKMMPKLEKQQEVRQVLRRPRNRPRHDSHPLLDVKRLEHAEAESLPPSSAAGESLPRACCSTRLAVDEDRVGLHVSPVDPVEGMRQVANEIQSARLPQQRQQLGVAVHHQQGEQYHCARALQGSGALS
eukprot:267950-Hanusia_phi.AAC.1